MELWRAEAELGVWLGCFEVALVWHGHMLPSLLAHVGLPINAQSFSYCVCCVFLYLSPPFFLFFLQVSSKDEDFLDLSVDVEQNTSITHCLR